MSPRLVVMLPLLLAPFAVACGASPAPPAASAAAAIPPAADPSPMRIVMEARQGAAEPAVIVRADGAIERERPLGKVSSDRVVNVLGEVVLQLMPDGALKAPGEALTSSMTPDGELVGRGIKTAIDHQSRIVVSTRYGDNVVGRVEGFVPGKRKSALLVIAALPRLTRPSR
ncbi:MAG TPA: hypothetical protein PLI95_11790 [Polyangiaceae bacterium]|nr:hypothetical protein [Polyangiaceae bacterium]